MLVIFNRPGIAIVGIGCVAALIAMQVEPPDVSGLTFLALGLTWFVADVVYRFKWGGRRFLHHLHGGHLYFIPLWALGLLLMCAGIAGFTTSIRLRQPLPPLPRRPAPATTTES